MPTEVTTTPATPEQTPATPITTVDQIEGYAQMTMEEQLAATKEAGLIKPASEEPAEAAPKETVERPEWLPAEFNTVEEYTKEFDRLRGEHEQVTVVTDEEQAAIDTAVDKAALDMGALQKEWNDNGSFSSETYAALDKAGYPKELVDTYAEGLQSRRNAVETESAAVEEAVYQITESKEGYEEMLQWASTNLSDSEISDFNSVVTGDSKAAIVAAVKALKADYSSAQAASATTEPSVQLTGKTVSTADTYESEAQLMTDIRDPRYESDPAFRAKVEAKLKRTQGL